VGLRHVGRRELPARLAEHGLQAAEAPVEIVGEHREPEVLVLLPVPVGRELGQAAEALLALPEDLLGLLALDEQPDLRADHVDRLEQVLVGLADLAAVEAEGAYDLAARCHREHERAVHPGLVCDRLARGARVAHDVGDPERLTGLPDGSQQPDSGLVGDLARALDVQIEFGAGLRPELVEAENSRFLVDAEEAAAIPVERAAHHADSRLETGRDAVRLHDAARHGVLEPQQLLGALGREGAPRDSGPESGGLSHVLDSPTFRAPIASPGYARRAWPGRAPRQRRGSRAGDG